MKKGKIIHSHLWITSMSKNKLLAEGNSKVLRAQHKNRCRTFEAWLLEAPRGGTPPPTPQQWPRLSPLLLSRPRPPPPPPPPPAAQVTSREGDRCNGRRPLSPALYFLLVQREGQERAGGQEPTGQKLSRRRS